MNCFSRISLLSCAQHTLCVFNCTTIVNGEQSCWLAMASLYVDIRYQRGCSHAKGWKLRKIQFIISINLFLANQSHQPRTRTRQHSNPFLVRIILYHSSAADVFTTPFYIMPLARILPDATSHQSLNAHYTVNHGFLIPSSFSGFHVTSQLIPPLPRASPISIPDSIKNFRIRPSSSPQSLHQVD